MASFVRALSEAKDEIKHNVNLAKEEVLAKMETQSGIRKQKEFEKPDEDNRDIQVLLFFYFFFYIFNLYFRLFRRGLQETVTHDSCSIMCGTRYPDTKHFWKSHPGLKS